MDNKYNYSPKSTSKSIANCNSIATKSGNIIQYRSFNTVIAISDGSQCIMTDREYSITTRKHKNFVRRVESNLTVIKHENFIIINDIIVKHKLQSLRDVSTTMLEQLV